METSVRMASLTAAHDPYSATATRPNVVATQRGLMWLVGASSAIVFIEPSPYEVMTLIAVVFFFATGLRMRPAFMPSRRMSIG